MVSKEPSKLPEISGTNFNEKFVYNYYFFNQLMLSL